MSRCERKSIVLSGGPLWNLQFPPSWVALLTVHLFNHDFRVNRERIYPSLRIDPETRRQQDNEPELKAERIHQNRIINKALAGELLSGLLLTYLNSASEIRSWCEVRDGLPHKYAGPGFSDLVARYQDARNQRAFRLVVEVSAKREVTAEHFGKQLNQAWKHAEELASDDEGGDVYGLVITGGAIGMDVALAELFRKFAEEKGMEPDGPIRIVPMYAGDLAAAMRRMEETLAAEASRFTPALLAEILDTLFGTLVGSIPQQDFSDEWMCNLMVDMAESEAEEETQLGLSQGPPSEGGTAEPGSNNAPA